METNRFWRYENGLLIMLFVANGLMFFDRLAINFLMPFLRGEFGLSNAQVGGLNAVLGLAWAVSGWLLAQSTDRREIKRPVLVLAVVAFSVCSIASGLVGSFVSLLIARAVMGIAEGPILPVSQSLMIVESSRHRRGFNMGFIQAVAGGLFGSVLGPVIIVPLADALGWRVAFFLAGAPGLVMALVLWRYVREPSLEKVAQRLQHPTPVAGAYEGVTSSVPEGFLTRNVILCVMIASLFITTFYSIVVFAPLFLVEQRHLSTVEMSVVMGILGVSGVLGGALMPALSDRWGRRPTMLLSLLLTALSPLAVAFLPGSIAVLCTGLFLTYLGVGSFPIFLATIPAESVSGRHASKAIGMVIGVGEILGGCVSPMVAGIAADRFGPTTPFSIGAVTAVLAAICALGLRETAPRCIEPKDPTPAAEHLDVVGDVSLRSVGES